ncbi:MAG: Na/Pi symporter [Kiritimatiellia bacterium]|jgi:phosphate:Na+ symporter|nr:Na/Pi symporter [Kiritimatiellia bacterium]MDD4440868.1 Na/Pi symporter [Kiritimatiellia bacterium]MDX9791888.1 Na/Pi symporter [Kiritimatiellia bacterium]
MATTCSILINTAGGLGIFLLGLNQLSEGLQAVAGKRLRKIVAACTSNRFAGIVTGAFVTGIVQSSSVVTVMVVGLVTAGVMTLRQAVNVVVGSNIGSTTTAWFVVLLPTKLGDQSMIIIAVAALFYLFAKREKVRYTALASLGIGLVFFGLELMSKGLSPLRSDPGFIEWFHMFDASTLWGVLKCVLMGSLVTAVIQSSAASAAISISLAYNGVISFETAVALVFGMNIGTTITAWLAALTASTEARRAALAHTLFNCIGVVVLAPLFMIVIVPWLHHAFPAMMEGQSTASGMVYPKITAPIALVHTGFNVVNTFLFLPFLGLFTLLVRHLIPDSVIVEQPHLAKLDPVKLSPVIAVEQARQEVHRMASCALKSLNDFREILAGTRKEELERSIFEAEDMLDTVQHEVSDFLGKVMSAHLPLDVAYRARMLLRVADEYESVSDEVQALLKMIMRMRSNGMTLSDEGRDEMLALHDMCSNFADKVTEAFRLGKSLAPEVLANMHTQSHAISQRIKEVRAAQLQRLTDHDPNADPIKVVLLMDLLNVYRRLKEDCLNIGEAIIDERGDEAA